MLVDLAHEAGNPRQLQVLAASLGVPATADAARLLARLRRWATDDAGDRLLHGGRAADERLRPRTLARAVGWRGDPSVLMAALAQAHIIEGGPSGMHFRSQDGALRGTPGPRTPRSQPLHARQQRLAVPAPVLWQAALRELAALMNRANYDAFLADTAGLYCMDGWLTVGVPSAYAVTTLADRFRSAMDWALYVVSGQRLRVRLVHAPPSGPLLHLTPPDGDSFPDSPLVPASPAPSPDA